MAQPTGTELDIARVRAAVNLPTIISADLPLQKNGKGMVACCPFHKEKTPSFHVYADHYHCFGCGEHGDVFDWLKAKKGMNYREAIDHLEGSAAAKPRNSDPQWFPVMPVPENAPAPSHADAALVHEYRNASGELLFYVRRYNFGSKKSFSPYTYGRFDGKLGWHSKAPHEPRPLYGLDRLARLTGTPIICEGEKAADAAQAMFPASPCMTWPNGANSVNKADWTPLEGMSVIVWPDHDEAGVKATAALVEHLHAVGATVRIVRVDDLPPGADAADVTLDYPEAWLAGRLIDVPLPGEDAPPVGSEGEYGADHKVVDIQTGQPVGDKQDKPKIAIEMFADISPALHTNDMIEGILGAGAMSVIYGESNSGKTFFTLDAALYKACGWAWRERHLEQGGVIYCCLEGSHGIRNRVSAFKIEHGLETTDIPFGIVTVPLDLCQTEEDTDGLIAAIQAKEKELGFKAEWVIMDTLARAMAGGNENAPDDMGSLVRNGDRIRSDLKCHLTWIHHSGKDQARGARGHSSLRAATDTEIEVANSDGLRVARVTKQREYTCEGEFSFTLKVVDLGENKLGKPVNSCVVQPSDASIEAPSSKRKKLSKTGELGVRALHLALDKSGAYLPALPEYPSHTFAASASMWRDEFYQLAGETVERKRTYFARAETELVAAGVVMQRNGFVWLIKQGKSAE